MAKSGFRPTNIRRKWGPLRSLLALSPVLIGAPLLGLYQHFDLAPPLTELINPITHLPQLSEARILEDTKHLSEGIGYRTVGTKEHALADDWMVQRAHDIQRLCEKAVREAGGKRKLECEVWRQEGSGSHRFDMMSKRLYKTYVSLSNIIIRISDGTERGKEHAVLVNAHLDSTLPSPGAADDALCVSIMLDCARVLVGTKDWEPNHAIILLFNNAEESLQDGSHLYSTQHPTAKTVRAVINLEAAGTEGRELLFQATSPQMVRAYSHVPRPFGTIFANDIFSSGIILSDTDFRQFEQYLNVTGLDMAVVGNSYLYHMQKDLVENIQPGVAQNMAENTLALIQHLSSSESPLPELAALKAAGAEESTASPDKMVYFSFLGIFFMYTFRTARLMSGALWLFSGGVVAFLSSRTKTKTTKKASTAVWLLAPPAGLIGAALGANVVAFIMSTVLGKSMSWFSNAYAPIPLFGVAAVAGVFLSQLPFRNCVSEHEMLSTLLLMQTSLAFFIQLAGVGSSVIFFLAGLPLSFALLFNHFITRKEKGNENQVSLWTYVLGTAFPLMNGTILVTSVAEVFVPLTGRIGSDAPADHIVASIVSVLGFIALPLVVPYAHRFSVRTLKRSIIVLCAITILLMGAYARREVFDEMHQKRVFVLHLENVTSGETNLHIAAADGAPGFKTLVQDMTATFGLPGTEAVPLAMNGYNSDWDSLYPFSAFLTPYKVQLPSTASSGYVSPFTAGSAGEFTVRALIDDWDWEKRERRMTLEVVHPGVIWTVIAFDAHVLRWSLDSNPPDSRVRHHIKEASYYGVSSYTIDLVILLDASSDLGFLDINFVGIRESSMYPGKKSAFVALKEEGREWENPAMVFFEQVDEWLDEKKGGKVDALLMGCVGGKVVV